MSLDAYRINWRESARLRKQATDAYLAAQRQGERPEVDLATSIFAVFLTLVGLGFVYLTGYTDGGNATSTQKECTHAPVLDTPVLRPSHPARGDRPHRFHVRGA